MQTREIHGDSCGHSSQRESESKRRDGRGIPDLENDRELSNGIIDPFEGAGATSRAEPDSL